MYFARCRLRDLRFPIAVRETDTPEEGSEPATAFNEPSIGAAGAGLLRRFAFRTFHQTAFWVPDRQLYAAFWTCRHTVSAQFHMLAAIPSRPFLSGHVKKAAPAQQACLRASGRLDRADDTVIGIVHKFGKEGRRSCFRHQDCDRTPGACHGDIHHATLFCVRHISPVSWICEVLGVSRSGSHALLRRPISARASYDAKLVVEIDKSFKASDRPYGARRVWRDMLDGGLACGPHRIERLMRQNAMRARPKRCGKPKDDGERSVIANNILDRDFEADRPNQKWLAEFTYIWTAEGWLYVSVVLDLFSRRVVGWSMKADPDASLVMDALMMADWRCGRAGALLHHSDQGSQYTSEPFQRLLLDNGITCSISRAGNVWDNSAM